MTTQKTLITAEQLIALSPQEGRFELVQGELVPMTPTGVPHAIAAGNIAYLLSAHTRPRDLGRVLVAEVGFVLDHNLDTVRAPDVAFVRKVRIPSGMMGFF